MPAAFPIRLVVLILLAAGCSKGPAEPSTEERIRRLAEEVERQRQGSAAAVAAYAPKVVGRLDDLRANAAAILRQLPGVARVEVLVAVPKPTHRIIHLRDWHHVPRDLFALGARQHAPKRLSEAEVDALYREHLLEVELVQLELTALLRCLVQHHHLRRLLAEGLTPRGMPVYRQVIAALRDMDRQLADLRKQRAGYLAGKLGLM
jgi:hypothetical protein